jgi:hypothetical protein
MNFRSQKSKVKSQKSERFGIPLFCILAFSALALFLAGCKLNDGVLRRSAADYFPLRTGSEWRYDLGGTTSLVQVRGDSLAYNYPVTVVLRDYEEEYWLESQGDVSRFVNTVVNRGGTDYPLEQRFRRFYVLPFVLGNSWSDDFDDTVDVLGDTIHYRHKIDGKVAAIAPVTVPAGSFADCYEVDLNELVVMNDSVTNTSTQEWYAPGVGLVKRIQGSSEELLTEDSIP